MTSSQLLYQLDYMKPIAYQCLLEQLTAYKFMQ